MISLRRTSLVDSLPLTSCSNREKEIWTKGILLMDVSSQANGPSMIRCVHQELTKIRFRQINLWLELITVPGIWLPTNWWYVVNLLPLLLQSTWKHISDMKSANIVMDLHDLDFPFLHVCLLISPDKRLFIFRNKCFMINKSELLMPMEIPYDTELCY